MDGKQHKKWHSKQKKPFPEIAILIELIVFPELALRDILRNLNFSSSWIMWIPIFLQDFSCYILT